jgi:hypothetical protein
MYENMSKRQQERLYVEKDLEQIHMNCENIQKLPWYAAEFVICSHGFTASCVTMEDMQKAVHFTFHYLPISFHAK